MTTKSQPKGTSDPLAADFRNFLFAAWKKLGLPKPTKVQYDIAYYLQHGHKRKVVEAFRGIGKSWITSVYVLWLLYRDPDIKILVVSANKNRADDFSTFVQTLISDWSLLAHLKPKEGQRYSKVAFDVGPCRPAHAPSVKSVGVFGMLQGPRANVIVADDVEAMNNADTVGKREKLGTVIKEFDSIIVPGGEIVYLGTPQTESSIYNVLPERGYETRIWPALYPDNEQQINYGNKLAPLVAETVDADESLVGTPTDPDRFDMEDLESRRLSYGRAGFALQFMLDTSLSDADRYPLRLSDLVVMNLGIDDGPERVIWAASKDNEWEGLPNLGKDTDRFYGPVTLDKIGWAPYEECIVVIDPSGRGSDETSWAVLKQMHGQVFLVEIGADQRGYDEEVIEKIAKLAKKHKANKVIYEANFGDGMAGQIMRPIFNRIYPVTIEEVKHHIQKERRIIDTLEPVMARHKLIVSKEVVEQDYELLKKHPPEKAKLYSLFFQMARITPERGSLQHDDRLDAIEMGVAYFNRQLDRDTEKSAQMQRDEALEEDIRRMEELAGLSKSGSDGFSEEDPYFSSAM